MLSIVTASTGQAKLQNSQPWPAISHLVGATFPFVELRGPTRSEQFNKTFSTVSVPFLDEIVVGVSSKFWGQTINIFLDITLC